jgi:hypothetical protein
MYGDITITTAEGNAKMSVYRLLSLNNAQYLFTSSYAETFKLSARLDIV